MLHCLPFASARQSGSARAALPREGDEAIIAACTGIEREMGERRAKHVGLHPSPVSALAGGPRRSQTTRNIGRMSSARVLHSVGASPSSNECPAPHRITRPRPLGCSGHADAAGIVCPVGAVGPRFRSAARLVGRREPGTAHRVCRHRLPRSLGDVPERRALHDGYESRRRELWGLREVLPATDGGASRDVRVRRREVRVRVRRALGRLQPQGLGRLRDLHRRRPEQLRRLRPRVQSRRAMLERGLRLPERLHSVRCRVQKPRVGQPELRDLRQQVRRAEE